MKKNNSVSDLLNLKGQKGQLIRMIQQVPQTSELELDSVPGFDALIVIEL